MAISSVEASREGGAEGVSQDPTYDFYNTQRGIAHHHKTIKTNSGHRARQNSTKPVYHLPRAS